MSPAVHVPPTMQFHIDQNVTIENMALSVNKSIINRLDDYSSILISFEWNSHLKFENMLLAS